MERKPPTRPARPAPQKASYRKPALKSYGSIQSITLAKNVMSTTKDGPGGGGKTSV